MRKAHETLVLESKGKSGKKPRRFWGIQMTPNACAEHEWGINDLRRYLGIEVPEDRKAPVGRVNQQMGSYHHNLRLYTEGNLTVFGLMYDGNDPKNYFVRERALPSSGLASVWSGSGFAIGTNDLNHRQDLTDLYVAAQNNNLAVWMAYPAKGDLSDLFMGPGLCVAIYDRLPTQVVDNWKTGDAKKAKLYQAVEDSGIEAILREAGKGYYALSPQFNKDGTLIFWLNPIHQDRYECGWYTVDVLKLWAKNTGPILKGYRKPHSNPKFTNNPRVR